MSTDKVKTCNEWSLVIGEEYVRTADVESFIENYLSERASMRDLSERVIPELREVLRPMLCAVCFGQVFPAKREPSARPTEEN